MQGIIARLRFCAVIASMALLVIVVPIFQVIYPKFITHYFRVFWARCLIKSTGAQLNIRGYKPSKDELRNAMIVSNHISWLDTVVILRLFFVRYVGKVEMLKWPILRTIIKAGETIFIDRKNKKDLLNVNQQVIDALLQGSLVGLYPEGKTTAGHDVMPFKAPILEAAIAAKSKVIPVVLSYRKDDDILATEVSFAKVNWLQTVMNTLRLNKLQINVTILQPIAAADYPSRDDLNKHLYNLVRESYLQQQNISH